jgi:glycosyltransferase involved in cell wall biosynthesis
MIFSTDPVHIVLLSAFVLMAVIQTWYYLGYYLKVFRVTNGVSLPDSELPPITVIICARNEAANLGRFLPSVLEQDYPLFEVVVVNDCSEDETHELLEEMQQRYPHLRVSTIIKDPGFAHAKKLAMLIGIKAAKHDLLVFTDADCQPESDRWLRSAAAAYADGVEIVLGYGGYMAEKSLLNSYIRYETMFIALQYSGMTLAGVPYMGVGRNLSYHRSFFFEKGGFGPHNHIMSGDDDLFVNRVSSRSNCRVMLAPDSFTRSVAPASVKEWARQKQRHFSTAKYYKKSDKLRLFLEPFSRVSYYALLTALLIMLASWPVVAFIALARLIMRTIVINKASRTFKEREIWFFSLFFDILSPFVSTILYITTTRKGKKTKTWK